MTTTRAAVYSRQGSFILHPEHETTAGVVIGGEPYTSLLSDQCDETELGQAVRRSIAASMAGVPHPTDWQRILEPLLRAANVTSWATFVKGTRLVSIQSTGGAITLVPASNLGARNGFESLQEKSVVVDPDASLRELGAKVRRQLIEAT